MADFYFMNTKINWTSSSIKLFLHLPLNVFVFITRVSVTVSLLLNNHSRTYSTVCEVNYIRLVYFQTEENEVMLHE